MRQLGLLWGCVWACACLSTCWPHQCLYCGSEVDHLGTHSLSCRYSQARHLRHATVNDLVKRSLDAAQIPSHLEPTGLYRLDGKRPDGASIVPWKAGKILVWDIGCEKTIECCTDKSMNIIKQFVPVSCY